MRTKHMKFTLFTAILRYNYIGVIALFSALLSATSSASQCPSNDLAKTYQDQKKSIANAQDKKKINDNLMHKVQYPIASLPEDIRLRILTEYMDIKELLPTLKTHSFQQKKILAVGNCMVNSAKFNNDGSRIVTTDSHDFARVWDCTTGNLLCSAQEIEVVLEAAYFGLDNKSIITINRDGSARKWNLPDCSLQETFQEGANAIPLIQAHANNELEVRENKEDHTAYVWDHTNTLCTILQGHQDEVISADFSPDHKLIVTASDDGTARIWESVINYKTMSPEQLNLLLLLEEYKNGQNITLKNIAIAQENIAIKMLTEQGLKISQHEINTRIHMRLNKLHKELNTFDHNSRMVIIKAYGIIDALDNPQKASNQ